MNENIPEVIIQRLKEVMTQAWSSIGSMFVKSAQCKSCNNHWNVMICPALREVVGGHLDGSNQYASFSVNVNKACRAFDKRPKVIFDTTCNSYVPNIMIIGVIAGYKVDLTIMSYPPSNVRAIERVYATGPKKGLVEQVHPDAKN